MAAVLTGTPRAGLWHRLRSDRVPDLPDVDESGCPECGRWLPVSPAEDATDPSVEELAHRPRERVDQCLVHGWRSCHAIPMEQPDLEAAAEMIGQGLADRGWTKWAHQLAAAQIVEPPEHRPAAIGQTLEHLRLFGPCPVPEQLETLVASSAPLWGRTPESDNMHLIWVG